MFELSFVISKDLGALFFLIFRGSQCLQSFETGCVDLKKKTNKKNPTFSNTRLRCWSHSSSTSGLETKHSSSSSLRFRNVGNFYWIRFFSGGWELGVAPESTSNFTSTWKPSSPRRAVLFNSAHPCEVPDNCACSPCR